jgi:hypothetical protein
MTTIQVNNTTNATNATDATDATNARCKYCKVLGHVIDTCPKLARINSTEKCHFCRENGHSVHTCPILIEREKEANERRERNARVVSEFAEQMKRQQKEIDERAALRAARLAESIKEYEESIRAREREAAHVRQRNADIEAEREREREREYKKREEYRLLSHEKKIEFTLKKAKGESEVENYTFLNEKYEEVLEWGGYSDGPCISHQRYFCFQHNVTKEIIEISCDI